MVGICSYGGYIPRYRLKREKIFEAMGWTGSSGLSKGEKAVANFDEDSLTMAVAAGMDCMNGFDRRTLGGVYFASTTMPYQERQNAGIIAGALGMEDNVRSADFAGSLKSGTAALLAGIEAVVSKGVNNLMVCSSDCRLGKAGGTQEMIVGDAATAFLIGNQNVIAEYKGSFSSTCDFVDHYRGRSERFDRKWEDRWIRDEGFGKLIPKAVSGFLSKYNLKMTDFTRVIYSCYDPAERRNLNKTLGLEIERVQDPMLEQIGEAGAAQPLVMLVRTLEDANPGDKILVVSFGNGCDVLYFEVTDNIREMKGRKGLSWYLSHGVELDRYEKYLAWRGILPIERGIRGEEDSPTRWSIAWRKRKAVSGFCGTKCKKCGTPQFPPQRICVNPDCGARDQMEDYYFSDKTGKIFSYTGDNLAASFNPPHVYGNIVFAEGGKFMMNFTDCDLDSLYVGMPAHFSFRIKFEDEKRGITRYFWKAVPVGSTTEEV